MCRCDEVQGIMDTATPMGLEGAMGARWRWVTKHWHALVGEPAPTPGEVELLLRTLELRRLADEVQRAHATCEPGKFLRVRASTGAYDDVLLECCRAAGVSAPRHRGPLSTDERFEVESALMSRRVEW